jgi:hypothetical protein
MYLHSRCVARAGAESKLRRTRPLGAAVVLRVEPGRPPHAQRLGGQHPQGACFLARLGRCEGVGGVLTCTCPSQPHMAEHTSWRRRPRPSTSACLYCSAAVRFLTRTHASSVRVKQGGYAPTVDVVSLWCLSPKQPVWLIRVVRGTARASGSRVLKLMLAWYVRVLRQKWKVGGQGRYPSTTAQPRHCPRSHSGAGRDTSFAYTSRGFLLRAVL